MGYAEGGKRAAGAAHASRPRRHTPAQHPWDQRGRPSWYTRRVDAIESPAVGRLLARAGVEVAILFGSAAKGRLRPDSDIDIGILPSPDRVLGFDEELALAAELDKMLGGEVDLVRLDTASTLLRFEVRCAAGMYRRLKATTSKGQ